ncbi:MAG: M14 family metallopeptidase [Cyanobacteria bacterium J06597_1]
MLTILDRLPEGFLDIEACQLHTILDGPTLIHLPGRQAPALFVSILLHGNEVTGLLAIQKLLKHYSDRQLPRALSLFVGNIEAAKSGLRRLDHQPDYNRIWLPGDRPEHQMAQAVLAEMVQRSVFASIDIHNNTGLNPHYGCITELTSRFLQLATLFGRTTVYMTQPKTVQSAAFAKLCPSIVVECGQPGHPSGTQHVFELLEACSHLSHFSNRNVHPRELDIFHTAGIVKIPPEVEFSIGDSEDDHLTFPADLDRLNFSELPANSVLATYPHHQQFQLQVHDVDGNDVGDRYFRYVEGQVRTRRSVMPSMLTLDQRIIRQDCLCYLMERYPLSCELRERAVA